ncbi:type II toxin-antitoxin system death-on-curing family toxin [Campylobacter sp. MIT 99-7217]|uniref:type II toxin-antitoxin system death-on-curing family toxin n=1 Tax=Campylobacter sp. MIT 99-7217 TaxID=535091 RepID=UPI0011581318|nr:type II toxin-antitoxin system death-on-curing family toxin [Campylobacter sp. MIT 99-7217]TQR33820.1 type II toxin-antitoxin system death-on-curing family toxin [Campylobacter sp. MIT 99-7217]
MKYINIDEAIKIHDIIIDKMQGLSGYNKTNIGYLGSALEQIKNDDFYPEFIDKLTHLIFSCIKFHPFNDANKRTSIFLAMHFLDLNGKNVENFAQYMEDVVVKVAEDSLTKQDLRKVLKQFLQKDGQ